MKESRKHIWKPLNDQKETKSPGSKSAYESDGNIKSADIKNAHASGIGSLERSDENQIEKLNYGEIGNDEDVY